MTNIFMAQVNNAIEFSFKNFFKYFKYKKELKKFVKKIEAGSPSLGILWNFAEFIKYAEMIYSYNNNKNAILYSSIDYTPMSNGFKINGIGDMNIVVKMYSESNKVGIDIDRLKGNRITTNFTFIDNDWTDEPDEYDILLLERIIKIINNAMISLLVFCINRKLGVDQFNTDNTHYLTLY